ncbi:TonB family C-terminal domain containing protein [Janthinobacterium sp. HH01]|uniref:energy transducer TonB n=1 Tax=Janthinobacterium sp. HH01 TaxID=1198452 RepID=UPI0002AE93D3|nr:energy transducer TonB [Janthinobacterium sp. HH01]ELX11196.1 TonB family C-terminal domain containing protein [Janthinobacterium sp. HH01]
MNTMTYGRTATPSADDSGLAAQLKLQWQVRGRKFAPLAAIVMVHAFGFYMFQSGMLRQVTHAILPQVVNVTFVASPEPLKPAPPPPKTVPVVRQAPAFIPPIPLVNVVQTEPTITVAPPQPRSSEPAAVSAPAAPPAPPHVAAPTQPKTVSGVEYVRAPQPVYPNISRRMGESGVVILRVLIGEKGQAEQVVIHKSSGSSNLDEAGRQAVMRALYKPNMEDGKPVPVYALVPINFQLG